MIKRIYDFELPIIGITGGIATGKSSVSNMLRDLGEVVICADQLVKDIYREESTFDFVKQIAPQATCGGSIDFPRLRELFFANDALHDQLTAYIYERLPNKFRQTVNELNPRDFIFYDVPLLFENEMDALVDDIILVYTPREIQLERLMARDKNSRDLANLIIDNQMDIEEKVKRMKHAEMIIDNSAGPEKTKAQLMGLHKIIAQKFRVLN